jgi:hypothetical protein
MAPLSISRVRAPTVLLQLLDDLPGDVIEDQAEARSVPAGHITAQAYAGCERRSRRVHHGSASLKGHRVMRPPSVN